MKSKNGSIFPMEHCEIADKQCCGSKCTPEQLEKIKQFSIQRPAENRSQMAQAIRDLDLDNSPILRAFNIALIPDLSLIESRVLPPPTMSCGQGQRIQKFTPTHGIWTMRNRSVLSAGTPLRSWAVVVFKNKRRLPTACVQDFVTSLCKMCNTKGVVVHNCRPSIHYGNFQDVHSAITAAAAQGSRTSSPLQLLLVILPTTNVQTYQLVKSFAYTTMGIHTQCMLAKHIIKPSLQFCVNLSLKINAKLGGTNLGLAAENMQAILQCEPTLFMGCDVTHPSPRDHNHESVASIVGSINLLGLRYAATLIKQPARQVLVGMMHESVVRHLRLFFQATGMKPKRIVFYRDGVGEVQFVQVRDHEIAEIRRACEQIEPGYRPLITFMAVMKRHNTRFFPAGQDGNRNGNCVPGTCIDHSVALPNMVNFYLYSHAALRSTSRPTHYYVLHDDARYTQDELQKMTYHLCYTYMLCTRSVSLAPPAYYAHRVANRSRCHFVESGHSFNVVKQSMDQHGPSKGAAIIRTHQRLDSSMYYV